MAYCSKCKAEVEVNVNRLYADSSFVVEGISDIYLERIYCIQCGNEIDCVLKTASIQRP